MAKWVSWIVRWGIYWMVLRERPNSPKWVRIEGVWERRGWAALVEGISRRGGPEMVKWVERLMNLMIVILYLIVENKWVALNNCSSFSCDLLIVTTRPLCSVSWVLVLFLIHIRAAQQTKIISQCCTTLAHGQQITTVVLERGGHIGVHCEVTT